MKQKLPVFLFLLFAALPFLTRCEKDPEIITKTVTEYDTVFVTQVDTVYLTLTDTVTLTSLIQDTATTFLLSRHAETTGIGTDPSLNADGLTRADELVRILKNVPLNAVYSTNFNRTRQTAQAVATDKSLTLNTYDGFVLNPLVDGVLTQYPAGAVLVVGHSNTTASLLNLLTGTNAFATIPDTQYDNLYLVTVFEKGRAKVVHLKYGKPTP